MCDRHLPSYYTRAMKRILQNALLVLGSTIAGLLILEALLWAVYPPVRSNPLPPGLTFPRPGGFSTLTPGFDGVMDNRAEFTGKRVRVDARGRRIVPAASQTLPTATQVHFLGDSQTFGHGLTDDESWPNQLQERFLEKTQAIRVVNWGVPAANTEHYWRRLPRLLEDTSPGDFLVIGLTWNDFTTAPGPLDLVAPKADSAKLATGAQQYKERAFPGLADAKAFLTSLSGKSAVISALLPSFRSIYYRFRDRHPVADILASGVTENVFELLAGMRQRAEAAELRFAVLFLTNGVFLVDKAYGAFSQNGRFFPSQNVMGDAAKPLCKVHRLHCIDAFEALHVNAGDGMIYPIDGHYSPQGAERIADYVMDALAPSLLPEALKNHRATK